MDKNYKIGSGTIGSDDFQPVDSTGGSFTASNSMGTPVLVSDLNDPQTPVLQKEPSSGTDKSVSGAPLSSSDSFLKETSFTTPDFLSDPTYYNSGIPDFVQNDKNGGVITTFVPDKEEIAKEKIKPVEKTVEVVNNDYKVDYNYNSNPNAEMFDYSALEPYPQQVVAQQTVETFSDPLLPKDTQSLDTNYIDYEVPTRNSLGGWIGAVLIVLICGVVLAFLAFLTNNSGINIFQSGKISGISDSNLKNQIVSLSDDIDFYFEIIKSEYFIDKSSNEIIYSDKPGEYWSKVRIKGGSLLDKIERLQLNLDQQIAGREIEEESEISNLKLYLESTHEYVDLHYKTSEMFIYMERDLNVISRNIRERDDLLSNNSKIDNLRAGLQNVKGEISEELASSSDLNKSKILEYYYNIFNNYYSILGELKKSISFGKITEIKQDLGELLLVYSEDQKYIEETRFYVDYTTLSHVKYVLDLKQSESI